LLDFSPKTPNLLIFKKVNCGGQTMAETTLRKYIVQSSKAP